jgi:Mg-chelatase subunit ChlD
MRSLLLGLVPLACTVSSAAPLDREPPRPAKKIAAPSAPIIEKGQGCAAEIADDEVASAGGGRGAGGAPRRAKLARPAGGDAEADRAPSAAPALAEPSGRMAPPPAPPPPGVKGRPDARRPAGPMVQHAPAGVRAGEWDDNANYRDYMGWLSGKARGVARLDVSSRQFVVVTDRDGKAMPNCRIDLRGAAGAASLTTMASGRAMVFPAALGLGGELTATASCGGAPVSAKLDTRTLDGVAHLRLDLARQLPARRTIDLAFVLDTTGSMSEEIEAVKQTIHAVSDQLGAAQTDVRVGLVEYKDRTDCLLTRTFPFSSDLRAFSDQVASLAASGGGDTPEDMHAGLAAALDKLSWRAGAVARMVVVIADAPPHLDYQNQRDYADAAKRAAARGIKLYSVSASGMDDTGQVVMRQLAQLTGGSNMFVLRGGAGPQSVGGGDPKSACGGTHEDYSSGKLDQLIMRKVRTELASLDADPLKIPGRGQDENAKPCSQRLVLAN